MPLQTENLGGKVSDIIHLYNEKVYKNSCKTHPFFIKIGIIGEFIGGHPSFKKALNLYVLRFQNRRCIEAVVSWYFMKKFVTKIIVMRPIC
ncbi:MAG: hypothetical protein A2173_06035 [Planctomycetes bacterium RBG_13_44_8b]|nr:MAG: hypothetical protein A2173_06035 [Planctomycetes bacterium RBG_13_44_8b]